MRKQGSLIIQAFAISSLLIISGCGVKIKVDDPYAAAKTARSVSTKVAEDRRQTEASRETEQQPEQAIKPDSREFSDIITPFPGSDRRYDDRIGWEEWFHFVDEETVKPLSGVIRREFFTVPEGRSGLEVIRYYQSKIREQGGEIFFHSRQPLSLKFDEKDLLHYFNQQRESRGISTYVFDHTDMPGHMTEFMSAKVKIDEKDVYIVVAVGNPRYNSQRYEVVTVVDEPMTW